MPLNEIPKYFTPETRHLNNDPKFHWVVMMIEFEAKNSNKFVKPKQRSTPRGDTRPFAK